jgi:hypothetical protein
MIREGSDVVSAATQEIPSSVELYSVLPDAAKTRPCSAARTVTAESVSPESAGPHEIPLSTERKIPPDAVPAKSEESEADSEFTGRLVIPLSALVQCTPASVEAKTPAVDVPTSRTPWVRLPELREKASELRSERFKSAPQPIQSRPKFVDFQICEFAPNANMSVSLPTSAVQKWSSPCPAVEALHESPPSAETIGWSPA